MRLRSLSGWFSPLFLLISTIVFAVPLYIPLINAFKTTREIEQNPFEFPWSITLDNFVYAFTNPNVDILRMYSNSILITSLSVFLILIVTPMGAYYIARNTKRSSNYLLMYFLFGIMIPGHLTLIPLVQMLASVKLLGTMTGLIVFYLGTHISLSVFLYVGFIKTVPKEIEESAEIDGAGRQTIFWRVVYPLLKPCTATVLIFNALTIWNDFMHPLILLKGTKQGFTITLGIYTALGFYYSEWGYVFAFVLLASIPMVLLFLMMQRQFISGLTSGAVKG